MMFECDSSDHVVDWGVFLAPEGLDMTFCQQKLTQNGQQANRSSYKTPFPIFYF